MENRPSDSSNVRVLSIDALRGFDMFWIIGGGAIFESLAEVWKHPVTETIRVQLTHVKWEGFRFEDLIFPLVHFHGRGGAAVLDLPPEGAGRQLRSASPARRPANGSCSCCWA